MTAQPASAPAEALSVGLVSDELDLVEHRIDEVPVVDAAKKPLGLIDVQDLVALKVIEG